MDSNRRAASLGGNDGSSAGKLEEGKEGSGESDG